ncbi:filamentous haemagglutinin family protein [Pandoraea sputorum]|uniref:filamentous haemagglutinin family protein n=1 Tax=Pandoraea sputorum TaxID=93222 RepID=UPI00177B0767|nr:filamentous haemagglutinin family protein [Pandoraea sputorum]
MVTRAQTGKTVQSRHSTAGARRLRLSPMTHAVALVLATGSFWSEAHAQQAFSSAWFAARGAAQSTAAQTGRLPNGMPVSSLQNPGEQQQRANQALQNSIANLATAAQGIAAMQAAQTAARQAAAASPETIPDGLAEGGLKVDTNSLTAGWINAKKDIAQSRDTAGNTNVKLEQTGEKAILNWETFNVGRRTTVEFAQQPGWAVLNRVNDPNARPSQIQGQIKADGTVVIVNRNGIQFTGTAQVDTRNLVAAAVGMTNDQFNRGIYGTALAGATVPTFANDLNVTGSGFSHTGATANVVVDAGARINTRKPQSVTEGGGYVLLLGREAHNRGTIVTPSGQTVIAGGDAFVIRRGMGTDGNPNSSTRGNEVTPSLLAGSTAGRVSNSGLIQAPLGDISLVGRQVEQSGVLVTTTSVNTRGTIHLTASGDTNALVRVAPGALNAIVLDTSGDTALDVQRSTLLADTAKVAESGLYNRRDQSLVQIVSSGDVLLDSDTLTLATGGQINVAATRRMLAMERARLDVSGAVGVQVAMSANNLEVNIQGNEQRDAPTNRDTQRLNNLTVFIDRRYLVRVPAGTQGYTTDRWYTPGGLLEVSGYLNTAQHSVGEWAAQGGTVQLGGAQVVTRAGSLINLAGGTLDVQTGMIRQSWLRGEDGQMYRVDNAPGDLRMLGVYRGFEVTHARWGKGTTEAYETPFIAPGQRLENGYTVGRDAGRLIIAGVSAVLEGDVDTTVYQGPRQTQAADRGVYDGYLQSQLAAPRSGQLIVGKLTPYYDDTALTLRDSPSAVVRTIDVGDVQALVASIGLGSAFDTQRAGKLSLDAGWLNRQHFGGVKLLASESVAVTRHLQVADGGDIGLHATRVDIGADLTARGGAINAGNILTRVADNSTGTWLDIPIADPASVGSEQYVKVANGVTLDARGLWSRADDGEDGLRGMPFVNGGNVVLSSTGDVRLTAGSAIDVSSGAALLSNGTVRGGKGGNVSLLASQYDNVGTRTGTLRLDGALRANGVSGGGTLKLDTGTGVIIGGKGLAQDGWLAPGETMPVGLTLLQDYTIKAGTVLPIDYKLSISRAKPGQPIQAQLAFSMTQLTVLAAPWTVPSGAGGTVYTVYDELNFSFSSGQVVPAGRKLSRSSGTLATNYVLPANVFPNGMPVVPFDVVAKAGVPTTVDMVLDRGAFLPIGFTPGEAVKVASPTVVAPGYFSTGFSRYDVTGQMGAVISDNARLDVHMPVLNVDMQAARDALSGSDPSRVLSAWLPPVWQSNAVSGAVSQRGGADFALTAGSQAKRGPISVGNGALIEVDPGRSITLTSNDQMTMLGGLRASSGTVSLLAGDFGTGDARNLPEGVLTPRSIWIGGDAVIDVAARPFTAQSASGAATGKVLAGGTIQIGAKYTPGATQVDAADAFVIVRPGATLDASGTAADIDVPGQGRTRVSSNGGVISLASGRGLYLDGDMKAASGGAGAAGGTLNVVLETPVYGKVDRVTLVGANVDDAVRVPRELIVTQTQGESVLSKDLRAGQMSLPGAAQNGLTLGTARIGVDRVTSGGFDNLSLLANGMIDFDGNVNLSLGQSLRLTTNALGLARSAPDTTQVRLSAPYVLLDGATRRQEDNFIMPNAIIGSKNTGSGTGTLGAARLASGAKFEIDAALIDLAGMLQFGTAGTIVTNAGTPLRVERLAFGDVALRSAGDLRLKDKTAFYSAGDLTLAAAQIYPTTDAIARIVVGQRSFMGDCCVETRLDTDRVLRIERAGDGSPAQPFSLFGTLSLMAPTIRQGGVLRAPMGQINVGSQLAYEINSRLQLLPGSETSVSANGLTMPYGGTLDGLSYLNAGADALYGAAGNGPSIVINSHAIDVQPGAVVDLSGGGRILGAAFLTGRGGSVDARLAPLMQVVQSGGKATFRLPSGSSNLVYAIVPGAQAAYAPVLKDVGAGAPGVGQQITIGDGVPGLPAGTYTLLPSTFALMPGAYRVELQTQASTQAGQAPVAMRNGSLTLPVQLSVNNTGIRQASPTQAVLTSADVLRTYSQYNEMSYSDFARALAKREGVPRALIEADAKRLDFRFLDGTYEGKIGDGPAFTFDGTARVAPSTGGYGSSLLVGLAGSGKLEILGPGATPSSPNRRLVSVGARDINAVGAARVGIGALPSVAFDATGSIRSATSATFGSTSVGDIELRGGAVLRGSDVFLVTSSATGGIRIEQGSGISTLGYGMPMWDSTLGYVYSPGAAGVLAVSNGRLAVRPPSAGTETSGAGYIDLGACASTAICSGETLLLSEGTIAVATDKRFTITDAVRYGTRNLSLAVGRVNVADQSTLNALRAVGRLADGLTLNQQVLTRLMKGDTAYGAPALENLSLIARDSINFFNSVDLSTIDAVTGKSTIDTLVLGTPAIFGYGASDAVARIRTDHLVWSGARAPTGAVTAGGAGTGSGRLVIEARNIEFGDGPGTLPDVNHDMNRVAVGFSTVELNAAERVTANHKGSFSVYRAQGGWNPQTQNYDYSGGDLVIDTPMLTGAAGSVNRFVAGGNLSVGNASARQKPVLDNGLLVSALGAEVGLSAGGAARVDTNIVLPSGKLTVSAQGDVTLADGAQLDLAGRKLDFFDVSKFSWGGDVILSSVDGNVRQAAASRIDLSAKENRAGKLSVVALGGTAGSVSLAGQLLGGASGKYDAGGTWVPFAAGGLDVRAQRIDDFAGLNARLGQGGVFGSRSFQIKQGDLVVTNELKAREVTLSVDGGRLDVLGWVDASGEQAGVIRLSARDGVGIGGNAVLDAHSTTLRVDSYGKPIEASNRAVIEINGNDGRVVLADGARMDVRAGTGDARGASVVVGTVEISARRLGSNGAGNATGNDIAIDAGGHIVIDGARSITVNGMQRDANARPGTDVSVDGRQYQIVDKDYLDTLHAQSETFMNNAVANQALLTRLAGLRRYTDAFHLRPGVEIVSATPNGDIHIDGDIDLSKYRYVSLNPNTQKTGVYGSGEAGALTIRAGGNLNIYGSVTDGFDTTKLTSSPDDKGWILTSGTAGWGGDAVVPAGGLVTLVKGTVFPAERALNYDIPVAAVTLPAGTRLPTRVTLSADLTLPAGTVLAGAVRDASGNVVYAAGAVLSSAITLRSGAQLDAGIVLPSVAPVRAMTWPSGAVMPVSFVLASNIALRKGAIIPAETDVKLPGGAISVNLRPADTTGAQGQTLALAPMLAPGSASWSMRLVAGADTTAADPRALRPFASDGHLVLSDTHYGMGEERNIVPGTGSLGVYRWGADGNAPGEIVTPQELADWAIFTEDDVAMWNGWGDYFKLVTPGTPPDYVVEVKPAREPIFSVLRTGTGDLDLLAGGNLTMNSLYGVYTAGTQSRNVASQYNMARAKVKDANVLGEKGGTLEKFVDGGAQSLYSAWYPEHGGNVLVRAQGDIRGDTVGVRNNYQRSLPFGQPREGNDTSIVGNWVWRQGSGSAIAQGGVPSAWWINFGTYATGPSEGYSSYSTSPFLLGFTGIGTLGGGNLVLEASGNVGMLESRMGPGGGFGTSATSRSEGLNLAVASTGRISADGTQIELTGGGDLDIRIGGGLNPVREVRALTSVGSVVTDTSAWRNGNIGLNGTFTNLRGATRIAAGALGGVDTWFGAPDLRESRAIDPFVAEFAHATGGPTLVLGDSAARIETRGDLVIGGYGDATRTSQRTNGTPFSYHGVNYSGEGYSWFTLWTPSTAIDLLSAGGNVAPLTAIADAQRDTTNYSPSDGRFVLPSVLRVATGGGNVYNGYSATGITAQDGGPSSGFWPMLLAPTPVSSLFAVPSDGGALEMLAARSIYGSGFQMSRSAADPSALPTPQSPAFAGGTRTMVWGRAYLTNVRQDALAPSIFEFYGPEAANTFPLFSLTPATVSGYVYDRVSPGRFYSVTGDIVGLQTGAIDYRGSIQPRQGTQPTWYEGNGAVVIRAGRDIVDSGTPLTGAVATSGDFAGWTTQPDYLDPVNNPGQPKPAGAVVSKGNLIVHNFADDISIVSAGRDIRYSTFYVAGPGALEVTAGRDVLMGDRAELRSLGALANVKPGDRSNGAAIAVAAGVGTKGLDGVDFKRFAARYLDAANLADAGRPFAGQPGKAVVVYGGELTLPGWLRQEFGYQGDAAGADAFLVTKQAELDAATRSAGAAGGVARRDLRTEFAQQSQLHLVNWLSTRFGARNGLGLHFDAASMDAAKFFDGLPPEQQRAYLRDVYFAELRASGREYNDANGPRAGSYLRGREAIATLFPSHDESGTARSYDGSLTMYSSATYYLENLYRDQSTTRPLPGVKYLTEAQWIARGSPQYDVAHYEVKDAGIHTDFGGGVSILTPGGRTLIGVDGGFVPGEGSGVLTQGRGNVDLYSRDSILLGQSRIFTTFGGNVLAWSAQGDINAGRGSKSTVVYTPQRRVYDEMGMVSLSPTTPNTGAGIATLNPIPEIPPGDIDLIAPLGTIDAGEAGIRVSGNVNIAALRVLNADNIQVQGKSVGIPTIAAVNVGALTNASATAAQAAAAAQDAVSRDRASQRAGQSSIFTVRMLGASVQGSEGEAQGKPSAANGDAARYGAGYRYDAASPVQILGMGGKVDPALWRSLSDAERKRMQPVAAQSH